MTYAIIYQGVPQALAGTQQEARDAVLTLNKKGLQLVKMGIWGEMDGKVCDVADAFWDAWRSDLNLPMTSQMSEVKRRAMNGFNVVEHLARQYGWSVETFGPPRGVRGVLDHIRKELAEIEADPSDIMEWVDVIILACDGAMRSGHSPIRIVEAWEKKQLINEQRKWPDWRTADPDKAIEHVK